MTLKDLISKKDYDYIQFRCTMPETDLTCIDSIEKTSEWYGSGYSKNGIFYPNDDDYYSIDEPIFYYKEEKDTLKEILTIIDKGEY